MRHLVLMGLFLLSGGLQATTFIISGNERTADGYIEKLATRCHEQSKDDLRQCLLNSKLFSEVKVTKRGEQFEIEVKDRWTLIPVPMIGGGGKSTSYGAMLIDSNAFGRGKLVVLGGNVSNEGHMGILMYKDRSLMLSNWTAQVFAFVYKKDHFSYSKKNELYGLNIKQDRFFMGTGYQISKELEVVINLGHSHKEYDPIKNVNPLDQYDALFLIEKMEYKGAHYRLYFDEGLNGSLIFRQQVRRSDGDKKLFESEIFLSWQKEIWRAHALQIGVYGGYSNLSDLRDSFDAGQQKGFRGTEDSSLWLRRYLGMSVDYQVPLKTFSFGTWTWAPFFDWSSFESLVELGLSNNLFAYGVGTYIFLKEIAVPGMGFELGYNSKFRSGFFSFSVGFQM